MFAKVSSIMALGAALTGLVAADKAVGDVVVVNNCNYTYTLSPSDNDLRPQDLRAGSKFIDRIDPTFGGKEIRITYLPDGIAQGQATTTLSYTQYNGQVIYDLRDSQGHPLSGNKVVLQSEYEACPVIEWKDGKDSTEVKPRGCPSDKDLVLTLCA